MQHSSRSRGPQSGTKRLRGNKTVQLAAAKGESSPRAVAVSSMVEDIVGCKWSLSVLRMVREGVVRWVNNAGGNLRFAGER